MGNRRSPTDAHRQNQGSHYLAQYLGEFDFRYNTRHLTDGQRTVAGLQRIEGRRLMLQASGG